MLLLLLLLLLLVVLLLLQRGTAAPTCPLISNAYAGC
jgi:preprotein translocase subunit SecG